MKFASTSRPARQSLTSVGVVVAVAGAAIIGAAAHYARGPDLTCLPEMVAVPDVTEPGQTIYNQSHEVTIFEWNACHKAGACSLQLRATTKTITAVLRTANRDVAV